MVLLPNQNPILALFASLNRHLEDQNYFLFANTITIERISVDKLTEVQNEEVCSIQITEFLLYVLEAYWFIFNL